VKEELLAFIRKHRLIAPGDRVLVAFSGGADSTCLLHQLVTAGFGVAAAHLHHSQRPEGDADLEHCRAFCELIGIEFIAGRADVPAVARAHKLGLEEAGRKLRYEFFQMVATQGFHRIATGHTLDDNLESMLLHLARGTGMRGLGGIPLQRGNVVRPILFLSRRLTHEYCRKHELKFVSDAYNDEEEYARNRVRSRVVATLREINPLTAEHAFTTARILTEENELLDAIASNQLAANEIHPEHPLAFIEKTVRARWTDMQRLPLALVRRCVRQGAAMYGAKLDFAQSQALAEAIHRAEKASFTAEGGGVALIVDGPEWSVCRTDTAQPFREPVTVDGETIADDLGWALAVWHGNHGSDGPLQHVLDAGKVRGNLFARSLKPTDKIDPVGRGDKKLLHERLARAGAPKEVRARLPIVCDMLGPVWAPLVGPDRRCAPTESTTIHLALRLSEITAPEGTPGAV
jgi:tRNA(Ile)-lysidine synthase